MNDLVEAVAARRALRGALRAPPARARVISPPPPPRCSPTPRACRTRCGWTPPRVLNRPGAHNAALHALERRALGARPAGAAVEPRRAATRSRPVRLARSWCRRRSSARASCRGAASRRRRLHPGREGQGPRRGLRGLGRGRHRRTPGSRCSAWSASRRSPTWSAPARPSRRASSSAARRPPAEFRAALRRARAYAGGARWEDFGQAPLEALADGALLVTVPSGGPFEALALARELAPRARGRGGRARRAGGRAPGRLRAARGARAALPRARRRAAEPFRPEAIQRTVGGRWCRRSRLAALIALDSASRRRLQDGALERLRVGLQRVALGHRPAARREPRAQLARRAPGGAARRRSRRGRRVHEQRVLAVDGHVAGGAGALASRSAAARPPRPRAASRRRARRCSPARARRRSRVDGGQVRRAARSPCSRTGTPSRSASARSSASSGPVPHSTSSASPRRSPASANASISSAGSCPARAGRPTSTRTGPSRGAGRAPPRRATARGRRSAARPRRARAATPSAREALDALRADHDEARPRAAPAGGGRAAAPPRARRRSRASAR